MSGSRLEKLGTIFSRVTTLLRSGTMSRDDKPIWYDVYQVFPPKIEPSYATRRSFPEIRNIFYPEDSIRAKFHLKMHKRLPMENLLQEPTNDLTRRAINLTSELMQKDPSLNEDQAVDKVIEIYKKEGLFKPKWKERQRKEATSEDMTETDTSERERGYLEDDQNVVKKKISDKNIDVSQFLKD